MFTFLALLFIAVAISGAMAWAFFWPMAMVHLRDRHPDARRRLGPAAFLAPSALCWLAAGRYRLLADRALDGLCTPARLALWSVLLSLAAAAALYLAAQALGE